MIYVHIYHSKISHAEVTPDECGMPRVKPLRLLTKGAKAIGGGGGRIVTGYEAAPHSFPWLVSMQRGRAHNCGGSIIRCPGHNDARVIVCAAHCFAG